MSPEMRQMEEQYVSLSSHARSGSFVAETVPSTQVHRVRLQADEATVVLPEYTDSIDDDGHLINRGGTLAADDTIDAL